VSPTYFFLNWRGGKLFLIEWHYCPFYNCLRGSLKYVPWGYEIKLLPASRHFIDRPNQFNIGLSMYEFIKWNCLKSDSGVIPVELQLLCLSAPTFCSSLPQNLMLAILLVFQNTPQAKKWMLKDGTTKWGGISTLKFPFCILEVFEYI